MTQETQPQRPPFKVAGNATIKHLNVRKEGPEDEKILAVDIKLEMCRLDRRLCGYFDDALEAFLWRDESESLVVRNLYLEPLKFGNDIEGVTVKIGDDEFLGCRVSKFAISPRDGGVIDLVVSVSAYPSSRDVSELAKRVQDDVTVSIEAQPDLFSAEHETTGDAA